MLVEDTLEIPVQVNGKLRDVIKVFANATQAELETAAKNSAESGTIHRRQNDPESHRRAQETGEHRRRLINLKPEMHYEQKNPRILHRR